MRKTQDCKLKCYLTAKTNKTALWLDACASKTPYQFSDGFIPINHTRISNINPIKLHLPLLNVQNQRNLDALKHWTNQ